MCATVLALQATITKPFAAPAQYQDANPRRVEFSGDREQPLERQWVAIIDEHGNRRLRMHWTVARVVPPPTVCKAEQLCVEPADGKESKPILGLQAQAAIS